MRQRLQYTGPRPFCSKNGIYFDYAKEDRYIYLETLIQLVEAIDKRATKEGILHFDIKKRAYDTDKLLKKIEKYIPSLEKEMEKTAKMRSEKIDELIERIEKERQIGILEKEIWIKNISFMRDYVIQRDINKTIYHRLIDLLMKKLQEREIRYLLFPMHRNFHHITKSLSSALANGKPPQSTEAKIFETENGLMLKFILNP